MMTATTSIQGPGMAPVSVAARIAALQKKLGEDDNKHKTRPEPDTTVTSTAACRIAAFPNQTKNEIAASHKPPVARPIYASTQAQAAVTVEDGNNDDATAFSSKTALADNSKKKKSYTSPETSSTLSDSTNVAARIAALQKKLGDDNKHNPRLEPEKTVTSVGAGRIAPFQNQQNENIASHKPISKPHVST
jgi:hypothetical protein